MTHIYPQQHRWPDLLVSRSSRKFVRCRYIFTKLSPLARALFPVEDDAVLDWLNDDGHPVEPRYYVPLIPLILVSSAGLYWQGVTAKRSTLRSRSICFCIDCYVTPSTVLSFLLHQVNGTKGIGTGWSTDVPCHKPEDVIDNLLHRLRNEDVASSSKIKPWCVAV